MAMSSSSSVLPWNSAEEVVGVGELLLLLLLLVSSSLLPLTEQSPLSSSPSPVEEFAVIEKGIGDCGLILLVRFPLMMLAWSLGPKETSSGASMLVSCTNKESIIKERDGERIRRVGRKQGRESGVGYIYTGYN